MKRKLLAGLLALTVALAGCQTTGTGSQPPADSVKEEAAAAGSENENQAASKEASSGAQEKKTAAEAGDKTAAPSGKEAGGADDEAPAAGGATDTAAAEDATDKAETAGGENEETASSGETADGEDKETASSGETADEGGDKAAANQTETAGEAEEGPAASDEAADLADEKVTSDEAAGSADEKAEASTGIHPEAPDTEGQIAVIAESAGQWIHFYEDDDPYRAFAVTDLDGNGQLEIMVGAHWATGTATYFDMWEVNAEHTAINRVENDFDEDEPLPDILDYSAFDFYSDDDGRHILTYNYSNVDGRENEQEFLALTLKDGLLTHRTLATLRTAYSSDGTDATGEGPDGESISSAEFWAMPSRLKNQTGDRSVWISWLMLPREGEEAWTEETIRVRAMGSWENFLVGTDVMAVMFAGVYDGDEDTVIASPGAGAAYAEGNPAAKALPLTVLSENENEISDTADWFERNSLEKPGDCLGSDRWQAALSKTAGTVELLKDGGYEGIVDLSGFLRESEDAEGARLCYAAFDGDVMYVSVSRRPDSDADSATGFIIAIDLNEMNLLWKSDSLVAGAANFLVRDGRILAGYGGTGEDDFLYQIDQATGRTLDRVQLATAPDYILAVDDVLYVRTYNTDYTFSLTR